MTGVEQHTAEGLRWGMDFTCRVLIVTVALYLAPMWVYCVSSKLKPGAQRLVSSIPALLVFIAAPFLFDYRTELISVMTVAYLSERLPLTKVIAFCLGRGPLQEHYEHCNSTLFVTLTLCPLMVSRHSHKEHGKQGASGGKAVPSDDAAAEPTAATSRRTNCCSLELLRTPSLTAAMAAAPTQAAADSVAAEAAATPKSLAHKWGRRHHQAQPASCTDSWSSVATTALVFMLVCSVPKLPVVSQIIDAGPYPQQSSAQHMVPATCSLPQTTPTHIATIHNRSLGSRDDAAQQQPDAAPPSPAHVPAAECAAAACVAAAADHLTGRAQGAQHSMHSIPTPEQTAHSAAFGQCPAVLEQQQASASLQLPLWVAQLAWHMRVCLRRMLLAIGMYCAMATMLRFNTMLAANSHDNDKWYFLSAFDAPFTRSTSLGDFWGRRWNVPQAQLLKCLVYEPIMEGCWVKQQQQQQQQQFEGSSSSAADQTAAAPHHHQHMHQQHSSTSDGSSGSGSGSAVQGHTRRAQGQDKWRAVALMATFVFSGLEHLLFYWYISGTVYWPWALFFVGHGALIIVEVKLRQFTRRRAARRQHQHAVQEQQQATEGKQEDGQQHSRQQQQQTGSQVQVKEVAGRQVDKHEQGISKLAVRPAHATAARTISGFYSDSSYSTSSVSDGCSYNVQLFKHSSGKAASQAGDCEQEASSDSETSAEGDCAADASMLEASQDTSSSMTGNSSGSSRGLAEYIQGMQRRSTNMQHTANSRNLEKAVHSQRTGPGSNAQAGDGSKVLQQPAQDVAHKDTSTPAAGANCWQQQGGAPSTTAQTPWHTSAVTRLLKSVAFRNLLVMCVLHGTACMGFYGALENPDLASRVVQSLCFYSQGTCSQLGVRV